MAFLHGLLAYRNCSVLQGFTDVGLALLLRPWFHNLLLEGGPALWFSNCDTLKIRI